MCHDKSNDTCSADAASVNVSIVIYFVGYRSLLQRSQAKYGQYSQLTMQLHVQAPNTRNWYDENIKVADHVDRPRSIWESFFWQTMAR